MQRFVVEFPLKTAVFQEYILNKRFEIARHLYNCLLTVTQNRYKEMIKTKRYQVCFSVFLIVIMICLMNYFNVLFDKNLIFISFLLIFSLPIATYGLMSYDLVQLIYKSRFYFQRGIISNHKNGKKKTHVFLTETETYLKENFPIKLGFDENCYDIEGKLCLLLEIHRNRKIVILL